MVINRLIEDFFENNKNWRRSSKKSDEKRGDFHSQKIETFVVF
jgi:hypothetical protein